eukprot:6179385-Prymnesium_polylepis.1
MGGSWSKTRVRVTSAHSFVLEDASSHKEAEPANAVPANSAKPQEQPTNVVPFVAADEPARHEPIATDAADPLPPRTGNMKLSDMEDETPYPTPRPQPAPVDAAAASEPQSEHPSEQQGSLVEESWIASEIDDDSERRGARLRKDMSSDELLAIIATEIDHE